MISEFFELETIYFRALTVIEGSINDVRIILNRDIG